MQDAMDDDEVEMTREELQTFIRDCVNRRLFITDDIKQKCSLLQSLFERKQKLSNDILKLFESVTTCEAAVRQLYSKLGWEYDDPDSEGNNCNDSASSSGATYDRTDDMRSASPVSNYITAVYSDEEPPERPKTPEEKPKVAEPRRELRVVLTRLPMEVKPRRSTRLCASKRVISDDELSNAGSDYQPSGGSSDSDFSIKSSKSDKQKKKKFIKSENIIKTDAKEMPVSQTTPEQSHQSSVKFEPPADANSTDGASTSGTAVKSEVKTETKPLAISERKPAHASAQVSQELKVGMQVLAKRKKLRWETGKIAEIVEKEDGTRKFKVTFEDKGKVLVSGHHIAYDAMPRLMNLAVGSRVVSRSNPNHDFYCPGILGELPSRKNHMRFLIFFDDQKTLYVALPVLRQVSKPLLDPLDDIRDEEHKSFIKEYLQRMPYPPHTQFREGQRIKVERDGVLETCTVLLLDCSLMEVVYAKDEEKEWIYRGSIRLEHIMNMKDRTKT